MARKRTIWCTRYRQKGMAMRSEISTDRCCDQLRSVLGINSKDKRNVDYYVHLLRTWRKGGLSTWISSKQMRREEGRGVTKDGEQRNCGNHAKIKRFLGSCHDCLGSITQKKMKIVEKVVAFCSVGSFASQHGWEVPLELNGNHTSRQHYGLFGAMPDSERKSSTC